MAGYVLSDQELGLLRQSVLIRYSLHEHVADSQCAVDNGISPVCGTRDLDHDAMSRGNTPQVQEAVVSVIAPPLGNSQQY